MTNPLPKVKIIIKAQAQVVQFGPVDAANFVWFFP
jgi:hypothetical protein